MAAGIAIQCAGTDILSDAYSSVGIAQIARQAAEVEWGKVITDEEGNVRAIGLRRCSSDDGELEEPLDPYDSEDAVILMKRRIQIVLDECWDCTATDKYIAAALAQNGSGFTHLRMRDEVPDVESEVGKLYTKNWRAFFEQDAKDGRVINTRTQLVRFDRIIIELRSRRWIVPFVDSAYIRLLKNIMETPK